jgi:hypothetical protein
MISIVSLIGLVCVVSLSINLIMLLLNFQHNNFRDPVIGALLIFTNAVVLLCSIIFLISSLT